MQVPIKLPLTLEWRGAPGCPSEDEARSEVEGAAAKLVTEVSRVRAEVVLRRDDVYELSMWMYTPSARHHKVLSARLCSTLLRLITLELRHSQLPEGLVHQAAEPREHTFSTRAGAIVGTGPTPRPAPGVTLGVGSRFAQARIELNFNYFMPHASPHKSAARSDLSAFTVDARGCFAPRVWRLELSVCGGAEAGSVDAKDGGPSGSALWGALFVVPGARLQVHKPVWVWAEVGPWFALRRPHFAPPDRPDLVSVRGAGGLALQFE
jgi:hypothetical protein